MAYHQQAKIGYKIGQSSGQTRREKLQLKANATTDDDLHNRLPTPKSTKGR
ncbi:hypothetical protein FD38_GL001078 [Levilactobacillus zymae DSM 19395]|nr:hypothetical protein FD38_GL001078 [Levilactobacillus zymae DSM 19395]